jgi:hypothetical protein
MLVATSLVPAAACCTLGLISRVAAPCSSTAPAIVVETRPMIPPISLMASTEPCVATCISAIWMLISLVALASAPPVA